MSLPCEDKRRKQNASGGRLPGPLWDRTTEWTDPPVVRSDNGLIFQSRRFRAVCRDHRLTQEFITPYTPKQSGMIERFFRSLKEECVWQHSFARFAPARGTIMSWLQWYNAERPHQALGYRSPQQYRAQQLTQVA